jgi:hypothetical protein
VGDGVSVADGSGVGVGDGVTAGDDSAAIDGCGDASTAAEACAEGVGVAVSAGCSADSAAGAGAAIGAAGTPGDGNAAGIAGAFASWADVGPAGNRSMRRSGAGLVAGIVVSLIGGFPLIGGTSCAAPGSSPSGSTGRIRTSFGDSAGVSSGEACCADSSSAPVCIGITGAASDGCGAPISSDCIGRVATPLGWFWIRWPWALAEAPGGGADAAPAAVAAYASATTA